MYIHIYLLHVEDVRVGVHPLETEPRVNLTYETHAHIYIYV